MDPRNNNGFSSSMSNQQSGFSSSAQPVNPNGYSSSAVTTNQCPAPGANVQVGSSTQHYGIFGTHAHYHTHASTPQGHAHEHHDGHHDHGHHHHGHHHHK